jgi:hypothetical protein
VANTTASTEKPEERQFAKAIDRATEQEKRFREVADKIRSRADLTAKGLGTVGTTILTALGISQVGDVFPARPDEWQWWVSTGFVIIGFVGMATVLAFFTLRLWRLNQPIFLASDVNWMPDLKEPKQTAPVVDSEAAASLNQIKTERRRVQDLYREVAALNLAPTLLAYEARGDRFDRIASRRGEDAEGLRDQASLIKAEVLATQTRALAVLVRDRAARALTGNSARMAYATFVAGVILFATGADWLDSGQTDKIAQAKNCGDASKAGATVLPDECIQYEVTPAPTTTTPEVDAGASTQRSEALIEAVRSGAAFASLIKTAVDAGTVLPQAGREALQSFLKDLGLPLAEDGIKALTQSLWRRYVDPGTDAVDPLATGASQTIKIVIRVQNGRPVIRFIPISRHDP